jgi:hypothetical protein
MKNRIARLLFLTLQLPAMAYAAGAPLAAAKIDKLVSQYVDCCSFTGTVLVSDHNEVIFKKGYGLADREWNILNTPDVKFRLGSITKQFTSMLIMQQVAKGSIKLEGHLSDYLPYYRRDPLELSPLPSIGITRLQQYCGPLRQPIAPGLSLAGVRLIVVSDHAMGFPVLNWSSSCIHAVATTPAKFLGALFAHFPKDGSLPLIPGGSAFALTFSRLAQRSFTLRPAYSLGPLQNPFTSKASAASLPPRLLRLLPAGAIVAGWGSHPLKDRAFARRTRISDLGHYWLPIGRDPLTSTPPCQS